MNDTNNTGRLDAPPFAPDKVAYLHHVLGNNFQSAREALQGITQNWVNRSRPHAFRPGREVANVLTLSLELLQPLGPHNAKALVQEAMRNISVGVESRPDVRGVWADTRELLDTAIDGQAVAPPAERNPGDFSF